MVWMNKSLLRIIWVNKKRLNLSYVIAKAGNIKCSVVKDFLKILLHLWQFCTKQ